jgi:hypothetical protein
MVSYGVVFIAAILLLFGRFPEGDVAAAVPTGAMAGVLFPYSPEK